MKAETPTVMLFWVKAEIDHALKAIRDKIARCGAAAGDISLLEGCPAQLHQVAGALRIFDLAGILRFTEAIEAAFPRLAAGGKADLRALDLVDRAIVALAEFVDGLSKGALNAPLRLYPVYRELAAFDGKANVSRRDLFYPDLEISAPPHPGARALAGPALIAHIQAERARYQRGMLARLRDPAAAEGAAQMRAALDALDQVSQQLPAPRSLWWAAIALIDGLAHDSSPGWSAMAKTLCTRLDFEIRNLARGARELDAKLLGDVLYALSACRPVTPRMRDVRKRFQLDSLLPAAGADGAAGADAGWRHAALEEIAARLETVKATWVEYVSCKPQQLARFRELVAALKAKAVEINSRPLARLLEVVGLVAMRLPDPYPRESQVMVMEMASAFLLAESIVEQADAVPPGVDQQIGVLNGWLLDAAKSKVPCAPPPALRADLIQKYNEAHLRAQVSREILANLQHAEEVIDAFARDPELIDTLPALVPAFKQIHGALVVLGYRRAAALLLECEKMILAAVAARDDDPLHDIHWIAEGLSTIGVYLEPCLRGREAVDQPLGRFFERFARREGELAPAAAVSQGIAVAAQDDATPESKADVATAASTATAPLARAPVATPAAPEPIPAIATPETVRAADTPAPVLGAPLVPPAAPDGDDEMTQVFLEEAIEVLASIDAAHEQAARDLNDRDALTVIRRGFHTLKGSGRMVGLNDLGEVAWEIEQLMNRCLEREVTATPELLDVIGTAAGSFSGWVARLKAGEAPVIDGARIVQAARELRSAIETAPEPHASTPPALPLVAFEAPTNAPGATSGAIDPPTITIAPPATEIEPPIIAIEAPTIAIEAPAPPIEADATDIEPTTIALQPATVTPTLEVPSIDEAAPSAAPMENAEPPAGGDFAPSEPPARDLLLSAEPNSQDESPPVAAPPADVVSERTESDSLLPALDFSIPDHTEAAIPARMPEPESEIVIGSIRLAPHFYDIYVKEAQQHLMTLEVESRTGTGEHGAPPSEEFLRAAHTLASISRTAAFDAIADLAGALEAWTSQARHAGDTVLPPPALAAIAQLSEMVACVARRESPREAATATAALRDLMQQRIAPPLLTTWLRMAPPAIPGADTELIARAAAAPPSREQRVVRDDFDMEVLPIFVEEALQILPEIGNDLRAWRSNRSDANIAPSLKRALHTLKGSARMAGAMRLGELAHLMESAVETAAAADAPDAALDGLEAQLDRLNQDIERMQAPDFGAPAPGQAEDAPPGVEAPLEQARAEPLVPGTAAMLRIAAETLDRLVNQSGEVGVARARVEAELHAVKQSVMDLTDSVNRLRGELREMEIQADSQMQSRIAVREQERHDFDPLEFDRYTRLQELTRMMAEGVHDIATVQQTLLANLAGADAALLDQARAGRDLQQALMRVRTVPFSNLAERLHRTVRQSARELDKKANLEIMGGQIEIDRSVLERIAAPLEHLLRNAVVHGLEARAERQRRGKMETGEISVQLRQEGDEIVITVSDDGAGIDLETLQMKGVEKGLIAAAAHPTEAELIALIFARGMSTAAELSELSGRGIGMDVVLSEITAIAGRIQTATVRGKGTVFTIFLPLTLAVTQSVLVRSGQRVFAIPSAMVDQVLRVTADTLTDLAARGGTEFRGHHYALHHLSRLMRLALAEDARPHHSILLLRSGANRAALQVDELLGNQEVVIKNIGPQLSRVSWISGATVLADGSIVLIINPVQLVQAQAQDETGTPAQPAAEEPRAALVMVVDDSLTVRKITGRLLEREGYDVLTAKDGLDALAQVSERVPDIMLVDIEMPRMDGFDLARNIRANPATAAVPIVMISSRSAEKHRRHALDLGVNAFIGKPYQESELLGEIGQLLGARPQHVAYH